MKKLSTIKFYNFLRSTTFILIVSSSDVVYKIWIWCLLFNIRRPFVETLHCWAAPTNQFIGAAGYWAAPTNWFVGAAQQWSASTNGRWILKSKH